MNKLINSSCLKKRSQELGNSKFERLKNFIDGTIEDEVFGWECQGKSMRMVFRYHFTKILLLNQNGYEYFYVANFKLGHRRWAAQENLSSRWYRAVSFESGKAQRLAQLNVMGITNSTLDQLQFNHYLTKLFNSKNQDSLIRGDRCLRHDQGLLPLYPDFPKK